MIHLAKVLILLFFAVSLPQMSAAQTTPGNGGGTGVGTDGGTDEVSETDGRDMREPTHTPLIRISRLNIAGGFRREYIVTGPVEEFDRSRVMLTRLGAELLRYRELPRLGLRLAVYDFHGNLTRVTAQAVLDQNTPNSVVGTHHLYSLAQGRPRVYAATMVGLTNEGSCILGRNLTIGLIDGPVDPDHPALAGANVVAESVLNASDRPASGAHGTAVAALLVGEDPDGALGGLARGAQLYAVSAFIQSGGNTDADIERIAAAIDRLLQRNVRLINMSFAGPENAVLGHILERAAANGAVMIAAAGNDGRERAAYPASHPDVIAVTAVDAAFRRYRAANFGGHIEFAAPGVDLYVASNRGGNYASGTSYAAPIVTALAARLGAGGGLSVDALRARLRNSAVDLGPTGFDNEFGWGLVRGGC